MLALSWSTKSVMGGKVLRADLLRTVALPQQAEAVIMARIPDLRDRVTTGLITIKHCYTSYIKMALITSQI